MELTGLETHTVSSLFSGTFFLPHIFLAAVEQQLFKQNINLTIITMVDGGLQRPEVLFFPLDLKQQIVIMTLYWVSKIVEKMDKSYSQIEDSTGTPSMS